jgi:mono/diheme cytochrome c family protein
MRTHAVLNVALGLLFGASLSAQTPPATSAPARQGGASQPRQGVGPADRPVVDPAAADRGRHLWATECVTCHGAQAHGTDAAPSLIRSEVVLRDRRGSTLGPFLKAGHPTQSGSPSAGFTDDQIVDLGQFLRQRIDDTLRGSAVFHPQDVLTGNAAAGAAYFNGAGQCTTCHQTTSPPLAGIGSRSTSPADLQQRLLFPTGRSGGRGAASPTAVTVTVTPKSGAPMTGTLIQMDDLDVSFRDASGALHVVRRSPGVGVVKHDPLQAHHDLLDRITDTQIHDLVAFLETLK